MELNFDSLFSKRLDSLAAPWQHINLLYINEWCTNIEYYMHLFDYSGLVPDKMTYNGTVWLHTARLTVASFVLYFMFAGISCGTGFFGCWKMSGNRLIATAILMLFAFLFGAAGMGLFHVSHFYELNKVRTNPFIQQKSLIRTN